MWWCFCEKERVREESLFSTICHRHHVVSKQFVLQRLKVVTQKTSSLLLSMNQVIVPRFVFEAVWRSASKPIFADRCPVLLQLKKSTC
jgi:hypothetical protein